MNEVSHSVRVLDWAVQSDKFVSLNSRVIQAGTLRDSFNRFSNIYPASILMSAPFFSYISDLIAPQTSENSGLKITQSSKSRDELSSGASIQSTESGSEACQPSVHRCFWEPL